MEELRQAWFVSVIDLCWGRRSYLWETLAKDLFVRGRKVEKDTKNTRRYQEEAGDGPPVIGTLYVQQWAPVLYRTGTGRCAN